MNTRNISIAAMAAFLALSMTAAAFAGPGQGRGNGRGEGLRQGNYYSHLTPEKQEAVKAIFDKYDAKFDKLRTQLWTKHSVLQALINAGNADEKKISGLVGDITQLRDQMRDTRQAMRVELEKETGIVGFGSRFGQGRGKAMGPGQGMGFDRGHGQGMGYYQADCVGAGPCWN